jgi:hypothetical protein
MIRSIKVDRQNKYVHLDSATSYVCETLLDIVNTWHKVIQEAEINSGFV